MELDFEINFSHTRNRSERVLVERKKIELSRVNNYVPTSSFGIIDSLCSSDEDSEQNMPPVNGPNGPQEKDTPFDLRKSLSARFGGTHSTSKPEIDPISRFSPVKKMFDPFVKSKSNRNKSIRKSTVSDLSDEKENRNSSPAHLHGLLKTGNRRGALFFEFLVKSTEDFYAARTKKDENGLTCVYTFYSLHMRRTSHSESSSLVGRMDVSCHQLVTEFVLCDNIHSRKSTSDKMIKDQLIIKRSCGNEIAAVVMQDLRQLGKAEEGVSDISSDVKMHVLTPAGNHGLPIISEKGGPARLLDRWRLGGGCDCGGWDMACPLDVFSNPKFKIADLADNRNSAQLFIQGKRDDIPAFAMRGIGDGKYEVDFHARLSSLQAFSISVAMLHAAGRKRSTSQMSQIGSPTLCARSIIESTVDALAKEENEEISNVNKKEHVLSSFVLNPPFSPIARV
ncbi:hypothetical protein PHJA_002062000 [Phtheirospermum japonicum]|uniref:Uncharacterized protein n=1 Tax=Phtheirospermum japonicum TaxID=374723 RepID=A0A830CYD4_9LAMI|nr:hypothetical protein PHJA_002062000 [Phtheirospermum japonicum]